MNSQISKLALLIAFATVLTTLESLIQMPVPFLRLGLANGVTILVLKAYGFRKGLFVTLARIILAGLIIGRFFQPVFFLSLSGGIMATLVMGMAMQKQGRWFSLIGISILGAFFHNLTQLIVASFLIHQFISMSILPLFLIAALITGALIGYFTMLVDHALGRSLTEFKNQD